MIIDNPKWNDNDDLKTFAMFLAEHSIVPPQLWYHDPLLIDKSKSTVAHKLAF